MNSLKKEILSFWEWFCQKHTSLQELLREGSILPATRIIEEQLKKHHIPPPCQILFSESDPRIILALSAGGDKTHQFIHRFWKESAPEYLWEEWNFLAGYPASEHPEGVSFPLGDKHLFPENFPVLYHPDPQRQKFDIQVVSPELAAAPKDTQTRYLVRFLQFFLGENLAEIYLGNMEVIDQIPLFPIPGTQQTTLANFPRILRKAPSLLHVIWTEDPTQVCFGYQAAPDQRLPELPRGDIISGYTRIAPLLDSPFTMAEELRQRGGAYCYLSFPLDMIPEEYSEQEFQEQAFRFLEEMMTDFRLGYVVGSAVGSNSLYFDVITFDEEIFRAVAKDVEFDLLLPAAIHTFDFPGKLQ